MKRLSQVRLACLFAAAIAFCGTANAAFTPPPGCTLWLDAGTITGVADGDPLAAWVDGIASLTFTPVSTLPTYYATAQNGQAAVYFGDATATRHMYAPFTHDEQLLTVFTVAQTDRDPGVSAHDRSSYFNFGTYKFQGETTEDRHMNFGCLTNGKDGVDNSFTAHVPHGGTNCQYGEDGSFNNDWNVHAYTVDGQDPLTDWHGYLNGELFGAGYMPGGGNALDPTVEAYVGGNETWDNWPGHIAEILVFDSVLSAGDIDTVNAYLMEKYAIPEPTSMALLLTGGIALVAYAWRKRRCC